MPSQFGAAAQSKGGMTNFSSAAYPFGEVGRVPLGVLPVSAPKVTRQRATSFRLPGIKVLTKDIRYRDRGVGHRK